MTIELRRHDEVRQTWPDAEAVRAFQEFWSKTLGPSWDPEAEWYRWSLRIPGRKPVCLRQGEVSPAELYALTERSRERGFLDRMARLHAAATDAERVDVAPFLAIEPTFAEIEDRLQVLRAVLSIATPPRHLGRIGHALPRPADATFTVTTQDGSYANGAGTMTDFAEWCVDVHAPVRVQVQIAATYDYPTPASWSIDVLHDPQTPVQQLVDALRERGFYASDRPGTLP
jgi:hypothetical protein